MTIPVDSPTKSDLKIPPESSAKEKSECKLINENGKKLIISSILTIVVLWFSAGLGLWWINKQADVWGENLKYYSTEINSSLSQTDSEIDIYIENASELNPIMAQRVKEQLEVIGDRAKTHLRATRDLNTWYYICTSMACFSSVIAGLCLADITRQGWANSNPYILGVFLVTLSFFILCSTVPALFQHENNISLNSQLYIKYINLEQDVLTSLAILPDNSRSKVDSHTSLEKIINDTNKQLQKSNNITIKFDSTKIPNLKDMNIMIGKVSNE